MASSAEGGRALAVLGQGELAAVAVSDQGERAAVAISGQGERAAVAVYGQGEREAVAVSGEGGRAAAAVSDLGEREAAAVSGQGGRAAAAVSVQGGRAAAAVSGVGEAAASGKRKQCDCDYIPDYPCTERLRWRRLLAYLRDNCYDQIYHVYALNLNPQHTHPPKILLRMNAAKNKLRVIFDVEDLVKRIKAGQLEEACDHVRTFAPIWELSSHAGLLTLFLHYLMAIHRFADGDTAKEGVVRDWFIKLYRHRAALSECPCLVALVTDVLSLRTLYVRNTLDWQLVRNKAAELVEQMVSEMPELKEMTRYPLAQNELYDVMPIRCSFRPRRQVKKVGSKKQATDVAKVYLEMKKRLVPSAQMDCHDYSEKVLRAGQRKVLKQGHPSEYLSRGVFTLKTAHDCKSIPGHMMMEKGHRPEHASNQVFPFEALHAYKSIAERMKIEQGHGPEHASNQAMKRPRFLESHRDTIHQGNALKRLHITGNFEDLKHGLGV
ncbi:unnamed protein product [Miscanthus lutarioriparius]|uniref:Uncharacterized protein n=1 Tax=Miscanthus lutarioriparius TaxID=422564 RepID=A0A811RTS1_9POAL|nr:unnamed protein product [Miscanthus lutarioriparius]